MYYLLFFLIFNIITLNAMEESGEQYIKAIIEEKKQETIRQYQVGEGSLAEKEIDEFPPYDNTFFQPGLICTREGAKERLTEKARIEKAKKYLSETAEALEGTSELTKVLIKHHNGYSLVDLRSQRNSTLLSRLNSFLSKEALLNNIRVGLDYDASVPHFCNSLIPTITKGFGKQYNGYLGLLDIRQFQDFFNEFMPWPYQHPYLFGTITGVTSSLITGLSVWYAVKKLQK